MFKRLEINKEKLNDLKLRDAQLNKEKKLNGKPSLDKPWLKYYSQDAILKDISEESIYNFMKSSNEKRKNQIALKYFTKNITYKELFEKIDKAAAAFQDNGIKQGDIVTLSLPNIPENIISFYALNKIGAIANMIDLRLKGDKLKEAINEADSNFIIATDLFANNLDEIISETSITKVIIASPADSLPPLIKLAYKAKTKPVSAENYKFVTWKEFENSTKKVPEIYHKASPDDGIVILHTSGTTGKSKGVVLTNYNFNAMVEQYRHSGLEFNGGDKFLSQVPPFLAYSALMAIHLPLSLSMTVDLLPDYQPTKFAENIMKHKPNHTIAGPADWDSFLQHPKLSKDFSYLKTLASGSDSLNIEHKRKIDEILSKKGCNSKIIEGYGMTEVSSAAVTNLPQSNLEKSVGIPLPKMTVCIYDNDLEEELGYNQKGEICFNGPTVMKEYYKNKVETDKVLKKHPDGKMWLHSGDIGYMNEDGFLFLEGRTKRIIIRHDGIKVSPFEIENIIKQVDEIDNVCVVGIDDNEHSQGQIPIANIVIKENKKFDEEKIVAKVRNKCIQELGEKYLPQAYQVYDAFPLTPVGKVDYRKIQSDNAEQLKEKTLKK